jgi:selenocysteine lyase/cysteine desulfurase
VADGPVTLELAVGEVRRREFPITSTWSYLNHASRGPIPIRHLEAATAQLRAQTDDPYLGALGVTMDKMNDARDKLAQLMNCAASDIALLTSTAQGLNLVAQGLDWSPGDQVISYELEFPNVVIPWSNLKVRGVETALVPDRGNRFELDDIVRAIGPRTRAIALSLVNFAHGFRAPIEELGVFCKSRGIWLVVDAIQAIGSIEVNANALGADILTAHAYKHLLGGFGISVCYCSERARAELHVPNPGWFSRAQARSSDSLFEYDAPFTDEARRFESSTPTLSGLYGFCASLDLLLENDPQLRQARVFDLTTYVANGLQGRGWEVLSPMKSGERSGIIAAEHKRIPIDKLQQALKECRVVASIRERRILRISPHFYNTEADVDRLFDCLDGALTGGRT